MTAPRARLRRLYRDLAVPAPVGRAENISDGVPQLRPGRLFGMRQRSSRSSAPARRIPAGRARIALKARSRPRPAPGSSAQFRLQGYRFFRYATWASSLLTSRSSCCSRASPGRLRPLRPALGRLRPRPRLRGTCGTRSPAAISDAIPNSLMTSGFARPESTTEACSGHLGPPVVRPRLSHIKQDLPSDGAKRLVPLSHGTRRDSKRAGNGIAAEPLRTCRRQPT